MSFSSDIKKFKLQTAIKTVKVFHGTTISMLSAIVFRTPVDEGRLRGNWQTKINSDPVGETGIYDPNGGITASAASSVTMSAKLGDAVHFVNTLPYAPIIEDGSSKQAPSGMVKVTVAEFQREINRQANTV